MSGHRNSGDVGSLEDRCLKEIVKRPQQTLIGSQVCFVESRCSTDGRHSLVPVWATIQYCRAAGSGLAYAWGVGEGGDYWFEFGAEQTGGRLCNAQNAAHSVLHRPPQQTDRVQSVGTFCGTIFQLFASLFVFPSSKHRILWRRLLGWDNLINK